MTPEQEENLGNYVRSLELLDPNKAEKVREQFRALDNNPNATFDMYMKVLENNPAQVDPGYEERKQEIPRLSVDPNDVGYWQNLSTDQLIETFLNPNTKGYNKYDSEGKLNRAEFGRYVKMLADADTKLRRERIAKGEDLGGWFDSPESFVHNLGGAITGIFTPRAREAIAEGRDPSIKDYALDVGQNVAYMLPTGMVASAATRGLPLAARLGAAAASNFAVPAAMEGVDALAYDEDENYERSRPSGFDVLTGGLVNLGTPLAIRGAGMGLASIAGGYEKSQAGKIAKLLYDAGIDPKEAALSTMQEGAQVLKDLDIPVSAITQGKTRPWINVDRLGQNAPAMSEKDAFNIVQVGKGIEDGSIKIPSKGAGRVEAPGYVVDDNGLLKKVGLEVPTEGYIEINNRPVPNNKGALGEELEFAREMDLTSPDRYHGTSRYPADQAAQETILSYPELVGMAKSMPKRIMAQAPMNWATNTLGKTEYGKKAETLIPGADTLKEHLAKSEREKRWEEGKVTFDEQHSAEYQDWWINKQLGL